MQFLVTLFSASNFFLPSFLGLSSLWVDRQFSGCTMGFRIHFVVDPHGWCCLAVIVCVWLFNVAIIPKIIILPHYEEGHIPGALVIRKFLSLCFLI
jgi:hypothetical protein